jgi:hypothetical protein
VVEGPLGTAAKGRITTNRPGSNDVVGIDGQAGLSAAQAMRPGARPSPRQRVGLRPPRKRTARTVRLSAPGASHMRPCRPPSVRGSRSHCRPGGLFQQSRQGLSPQLGQNSSNLSV